MSDFKAQVQQMTTTNDRYVTPTSVYKFGRHLGYDSLGVATPKLDAASAVILEVAPKKHRFNYPALSADDQGVYDATDYTTQEISLEFDFDDADGTTIVDNANSITLTEQGNPTFQENAAVAGLGKGVALDGTGDAFDILVGSVTSGVLPSTGDFTVEMVCKLTSGSGGAGDTLIACRTGADGVGWQLQLDANEHLDVHIEDSSGQTAQEGDADICTDAIIYICASFDRDGNLNTWVHTLSTGAEIDNTQTDISARQLTVLPVSGASNRLSIGGDAARTAGDCLTGTIYYVRVYSKALSETEKNENMRVLGNLGYPGWMPLADPADGADLIICKSGSHPIFFDLTEYLTIGPMYSRANCQTVQTATNNLDWYWVYA